jgi:hypothetical protein
LQSPPEFQYDGLVVRTKSFDANVRKIDSTTERMRSESGVNIPKNLQDLHRKFVDPVNDRLVAKALPDTIKASSAFINGVVCVIAEFLKGSVTERVMGSGEIMTKNLVFSAKHVFEGDKGQVLQRIFVVLSWHVSVLQEDVDSYVGVEGVYEAELVPLPGEMDTEDIELEREITSLNDQPWSVPFDFCAIKFCGASSLFEVSWAGIDAKGVL